MTEAEVDVPDRSGYTYVLVRQDLPLGLQMAQAVHAAFQCSIAHPDATHAWWRDSNYLVCLSVPDEAALDEWASQLQAEDVAHVVVREPDINDEMTAIAVLPTESFWRRFSSLPLAGKELVA